MTLLNTGKLKWNAAMVVFIALCAFWVLISSLSWESKWIIGLQAVAAFGLSVMVGVICVAPARKIIKALQSETLELTERAQAIEAGQAYAEFDARGNLRRTNTVFEQMFDYDAKTMERVSYKDLIPDDQEGSTRHRNNWAELEANRTVTGLFCHKQKNGNIIWLQGSLTPVCNEAGNLSQVILLGADATDAENTRQLREREMDERNILLSSVMESQAIIMFDTTGKILSANENFQNITGYTEEEILGCHHSIFAVPGVSDTQEYKDMWISLAAGKQISDTFERVSKSGDIIWMQGSYNPMRDASGNVVKVLKIITDTTEAYNKYLTSQAEAETLQEELSCVVAELNKSLLKLAKGDLTIRIETPFAERYEDLRVNFNCSVKGLDDTITSMVSHVRNIRDESVQLSTAADDLSHRTENQAAALEQSAAALEELTSSVKSAADFADKANADVSQTKDSAENSGQIVEKAVSAMSKIEQSSQQISRIIGAIEDIAFQTNLLALNAGVEAARAGDAGRGFAVVASEVQALATRSSEAAKEIKGLILSSSEHVETGVALVGEAGDALKGIVDSVTGITELVGSIASSSREQSVGLVEINTAVNQLDQVTQQNAAMVEEATAASHTLKAEADTLTQMINYFKRKNDASVVFSSGRSNKTTPATPAVRNRPAPNSAPRTDGATAMKALDEELLSDWEEF